MPKDISHLWREGPLKLQYTTMTVSDKLSFIADGISDNFFVVEVGFTESRTNVTEGLRRNVCVQIFNLNSEDIDPTKLLLLELLVSPNASDGMQ